MRAGAPPAASTLWRLHDTLPPVVLEHLAEAWPHRLSTRTTCLSLKEPRGDPVEEKQGFARH